MLAEEVPQTNNIYHFPQMDRILIVGVFQQYLWFTHLIIQTAILENMLHDFEQSTSPPCTCFLTYKMKP